MTSTEQHASESTLDYLGVGFGPSNLAIAIAFKERAPLLSGIFIEMSPQFEWHAGMLLDGSRMQISFLKDLVTMRDPSSPYTFLRYLKSLGRLERFINLRHFFPTRIEYSDYLRWVARDFEHQARYGHRVRSVGLCEGDDCRGGRCFRIDVEDIADRSISTYYTRNVIYAPGGVPNMMTDQVAPSPSIVHSSRFLSDFVLRFPDRGRDYVFVVAGAGQSGAEVAHYLLREFPKGRVHLVFPGVALRPSDASPFVNELFFSGEREEFYRRDRPHRDDALLQARNTNYGVVDEDLLRALYNEAYADEVRGHQRLFASGGQRLSAARPTPEGVEVTVTDLLGSVSTFQCDGLVLATGYRREFDGSIFREIEPLVERSANGGLATSARYRVPLRAKLAGGLYVQGLSEKTHGVGDSLLSHVPFRAAEIVDQIKEEHRQTRTRSHARPSTADYPPRRHVEHDPERLYAVMRAFPFATIISVDDDAVAHVTHAPLVLDRSRHPLGTLFGHMDRSNPQAGLLDGRTVTIVFHGPNAYISPFTYETDQLPTWNSVGVHVVGLVKTIADRSRVVQVLQSICELAEPERGAYRLPADEPRIPRLIDYIVGFEIEIVKMIGRFKLSQDRNACDRARAAEVVLRRSGLSEHAVAKVIESSLGSDPLASPQPEPTNARSEIAGTSITTVY